jgi:hypothetical protein
MYNRSELERRLKDLERTVRCKTRFFDSFEDFPETGVECALYVDESTGDIYVWNGSTFIKNESSGGGSELQALTDVDITAPLSNLDLLQYDTVSSTWKNQPKYISATATLTVAGWSLVGGVYEQDIANTNITANSLVNIIPDNADFQTVVDAEFLPANDSAAGSVKVYANNLPAANIGVTLIIFN